MRKALNENPMVQMGMLAALGVALAFLMFTTVLKRDDTPPPGADADAAATAEPAIGAASPAGSSEPAIEAPSTPPPTATPPADVGSADGLLPGKGLPEDVLVAYARNKAIALLVVDPSGISDQAVKRSLQTLVARDDVVAFEVESKDISKYSRITQGVNVSQAPALVVIRPRSKTEGVPVATVSYGFRNKKSLEVALEDALYSGGTRETFPGG